MRGTVKVYFGLFKVPVKIKALPYAVSGWSAMCDCGITRSNSLVLFIVII